MERHNLSTLLTNKTTMKIVLCVLSIFLLKNCKFPDEGYFFTITNNANHSISYYIGELYPDTLITQDKPHLLYTLHPRSSYKPSYWDTWEEHFSKIEKLSIFIFHTDTLDKYTWDEIRDKYMVLKRYDVNFEDFKSVHWQVEYPPTEIMKGIEQYPPYGQ